MGRHALPVCLALSTSSSLRRHWLSSVFRLSGVQLHLSSATQQVFRSTYLRLLAFFWIATVSYYGMRKTICALLLCFVILISGLLCSLTIVLLSNPGMSLWLVMMSIEFGFSTIRWPQLYRMKKWFQLQLLFQWMVCENCRCIFDNTFLFPLKICQYASVTVIHIKITKNI